MCVGAAVEFDVDGLGGPGSRVQDFMAESVLIVSTVGSDGRDGVLAASATFVADYQTGRTARCRQRRSSPADHPGVTAMPAGVFCFCPHGGAHRSANVSLGDGSPPRLRSEPPNDGLMAPPGITMENVHVAGR